MFFSVFFLAVNQEIASDYFIETYKYFLFVHGCKSMLIRVAKSLKNDFKTYDFDKK